MSAATIVLTEDDEDDYYLAANALREAGIGERMHRVVDGEELMDYLLQRGRYAGAPGPRPILIFLDMRLPKKSGWEALREIKSDARLKRIPVVVLTTTNTEEEVARAYDLGCNSFFKKPSDLSGYLALARAIKEYWLDLAEIPGAAPASDR